MEIKRILQVEDKEEYSDLVSAILEGEGITIELAVNHDEAVQALNGEGDYSGLEQYDALLLDMGFPGGSGADIAKMAREKGYKNRIVMFSGKEIEEARKQTKDLENIGYLKKPLSNIDNLLPALKGEYTDYKPPT